MLQLMLKVVFTRAMLFAVKLDVRIVCSGLKSAIKKHMRLNAYYYAVFGEKEIITEEYITYN